MVNNQLFDFEVRDKEGNTPLHEALEGSRVDVAYELLSYRLGLICKVCHFEILLDPNKDPICAV